MNQGPPRAGGQADPVTAPASLHPDAPYRRALVVANPIAGRGRGGAVGREIGEGLRRLGVQSEVYTTERRGDAMAHLRSAEENHDLFVSVGGDGTLREVFAGQMDPEVPVAVFPLGTANVLAGELGLPRNVDGTLEMIAGRRARSIDVARTNGHLCFLVTGIGLDGLVVREVEARRDGPITKMAYLHAVRRVLRRYKEPILRVEIDGEEQKGTYGLVLISNMSQYGGIMRLSDEAELDDGLYEVYLFPRGSRRKLLASAVRGLWKSLAAGGALVSRARTVRVTSDEPVPYQVDGDYRGETPVEFSVGDSKHLLLVP